MCSHKPTHCSTPMALFSPARTFVFPKVLPQPSEIVCVELHRPLGIVFEYDEKRKRAVAVGYVEGGNAEQRRKVGG